MKKEGFCLIRNPTSYQFEVEKLHTLGGNYPSKYSVYDGIVDIKNHQSVRINNFESSVDK